MSNTKNNTANKKNRRENGIRADSFGSKPHSNGDIFSASSVDREDNTNAANNTKIGRANATVDKNRERVIHIGCIVINL